MKNIFIDLHEFLGDFYKPILIVLEIIVIIIISILVIKIGSYLIRKLFQKQKLIKYRIDVKRIDTLSTIIVSVFKYTIYIIALITILTRVGIFEMGSVLATAGIGGIVIGLGAQSLIKDIISGFFIILEDQFVVGDMITIENMTGTVEELELRVTKIRNFNGDLYIIPNGEIKKITNHTRGDKAAIVDIPLAYSADINKAVRIVSDICSVVGDEFETIVEAPKILGITDLGKDSMTLRVMAKTIPNEQWQVERRMRMLIQEEFSREKIEFFDRNKIVIEDELNKMQ